MGDDGSFPAEVLDRWRDEPEVRVETSAGPDAPVHRTIVWIVVDDAGRPFVRSVRGASGRWYREAIATGRGGIVARGDRVEVAFEPARDEERIGSCSAELARKYAGDPGTAPMLQSGVLDTTLELRPPGS
jgi:hypothetical protein